MDRMEEDVVTINDDPAPPAVGTMEVTECDDEIPERGTRESISAIFQKANSSFFSNSTLTEADYKQIEKDTKNFGAKKKKQRSKKTVEKSEDEETPKSAEIAPVSKEVKKTSKEEDEIDELLKEVYKDDNKASTVTKRKRTREQRDDAYRKLVKKAKIKSEKLGRAPPRLLMEIEVNSSQEEDNNDDDSEEEEEVQGLSNEVENSQTKEENSQSHLGEMVLFTVSLVGTIYAIHLYENELVEEVRQIVARKSSTPQDFIQLFLGINILNDRQTIKESGVFLGCQLDAFVIQKTEKELYEEKSASVLKFSLKLPADPRRGQQSLDVYVRKTSNMREVRDKFARENNMEPSDLKLLFEGDVLDLDKLPEELDLENEDQIDVVINKPVIMCE